MCKKCARLNRARYVMRHDCFEYKIDVEIEAQWREQRKKHQKK